MHDIGGKYTINSKSKTKISGSEIKGVHSVFQQEVTNRGGDRYCGDFIDFWGKK